MYSPRRSNSNESKLSTISNLQRDPECENFKQIDNAIRCVAMGMQFLMRGIYKQALQKDEKMRKAVETIREVISGHIPMNKKGTKRVMNVTGDNEDSILWETLSDYGLFQFNRPLKSTLDEGRIDVTGLKELLNNCSAFVINGKKYWHKDESGWFPLFYHFDQEVRNQIAHNASKKMNNKKCEAAEQLILATMDKMVEIASDWTPKLDSEIFAKISETRRELKHSFVRTFWTNILWRNSSSDKPDGTTETALEEIEKDTRPAKNALARIGGEDGSKCQSAEYLKEGDSKWKPLPDLPSGRNSHAVAVVGYKLFVAGGINERNEIVGTMDCLNLKKMEWKQCPEMKTKRGNPIGCGFTNKNKQLVMVAGGWNRDDSYLSSTEIYDLVEEKWETAGNMKNGRWGACAVKFREQIWMMGGYDRPDSWLNSCEIFSIEQRSWKTGPEMNEKRAGPSATVANGTIYVAGGYSGYSENYESSVEYCKPAANGQFVRNNFNQETQGAHWTIMKQRMKVPRVHFGLGSMGGHIYAVGGKNVGTRASVEVFKDGEWKETASLDKPVYDFGGLVAF